MAKQPGSPSGGSGDSAAESRPISVSELLARRDAAIADEEREKRAEGRGRRRAGRDGSVSVSELTGEIPRITDAPTSPTTSDAAEHFPRSSSPVPRRASDSRPLQDSADPAGSTTGFDRSVYDAPPQTRDFNAAAVAERVSRTEPTSGVRTSPPAPRTPDTADDEHANAVTGIIPIVGGDDVHGGDLEGGDLQGGDPRDEDVQLVEADDLVGVELDAPPARPGRFADVIDDDFDAYRSFSEYDDDDTDAKRRKRSTARDARGGDKPKKKRGWFARKAAKRKAAKREADTTEAVTTGTGTTENRFDEPRSDLGSDSRVGNVETPGAQTPVPQPPGDRKSDNPVHTAVARTPAAGVADSGDAAPLADDRHDEPGEDRRAAELVEETTAMEIVEDTLDMTPAADRIGETAPHSYAYSAFDPHPDRDDTAAEDTAADDTAAGDTAAGTDAEDSAATVDATAHENAETSTPAAGASADTGSADAPASTREADRGATEKAAPADSAAAKTGSAERSPAKAWLLVIGEAILGLAVGVGLFWGFTELWRWNVYFALVLAVLVIFGIVSFTHAVRHSRDLFTTLLALGVGLIVTIGPLVLLAT